MLLKLSMKPTEEHKLMEEEEPRRRPIQIRYYLATIIGHTCVHIPVKFYYRKYILKKKNRTSVSESLITHFKQRKFENPCKMRDDPVLELPVHPPHLPLFISLDLFSFFFNP